MRRPLLLAALIAGSLVVLMAGTGLASATILLGNHSVASSQDNDAAGLAEAFSFGASASGTAQSISVYVDSDSSASGLAVGLYAGGSGHPGSLLASGSMSAPAVGQWNEVTLNSTPTLSSGTTYWLAVLGTGGQLEFRDVGLGTGSCSENSAQSSLTSLPSSWTNGTNWTTCSISAYVNGTASSTTTAAPANAAPPTISGTTTQGHSLSTTNGSWSGSPTAYAYQWQDCTVSSTCSNIAGATSSSYTLTASDVGDTVQAVVTASNAAGSASQSSSPTATITASDAGSSSTDCAGTPGSGKPNDASLDACGYPSPDTTGVPAATTLTPVESAKLPAGASWSGGELHITGSNVTISGLNIDGDVRITGPNATLKNSYIHGNGDPEVLLYQNASDTLMQSDEITAPAANIGAVNNANQRPFKISGSYIHDNCTAVLGAGDMDDNYIITDGNVPGCHVEDIYVPGFENAQWATNRFGATGPAYAHIEHNTLLNPLDQTAAVFLDNHAAGPNANVTEDDNLMGGGGYVTYGDSNGDGSQNIVITNNRFTRLYHSDGGYFGAEVQNDAVTTFSGNIWDDTLKPVTPNS